MARVSSQNDSFSYLLLCWDHEDIKFGKVGGTTTVQPQILALGACWKRIIEVLVHVYTASYIPCSIYIATPRWAAMKNGHDLTASCGIYALMLCHPAQSHEKTCWHARTKPLPVGN